MGHMIKYGVVTLLAGAAYVITMVLAAFSVTPVRKRMIVSATRFSRIDMLLIGCAIVTAALVAVAAQLVGRARRQDA